MLDAAGFDAWLKMGPERAPHLYQGQVVHPVVADIPTPGNALQVAKRPIVEPLGKQMMAERIEFDRKHDKKQEVADHSDVNGVDGWDGYEGD